MARNEGKWIPERRRAILSFGKLANKKYFVGARKKSKIFNKRNTILAFIFLVALFFARGPYIAKYHSKLGDAHLSKKEIKEAVFEYRRSIYAQFYNKDLYFKLGNAYFEALECDLAEKNYKKSKNVLGLGMASECYRIKGDLDKAKELIKDITAEELTDFKAKLLLIDKKYDEAIPILDSYFQKNRNIETFDLLLTALALKDWLLATDRYKQENYKTDFGERLQVISAVASPETKKTLLSQELIAKNLSDLATVVLNEVITSKPDYRDAYLVLSRVNFIIGKSDEALKNASKAVELDPYHLGSYLFLSELYEKLGKKEEAINIRKKTELLKLPR